MTIYKENHGGKRTSTTDTLNSLTDDYEELTAYHYLVFGVLDIYPETNQYFNRETKKRGMFYSYGKMEKYISELAEEKGIELKQQS